MSTLPGIWNLTMRTPIGTMRATMTFTQEDGVWAGTADGEGDKTAIPLRDIRTARTADGEHVTCRRPSRHPCGSTSTSTSSSMANT